ncbi:unnamed protein product [Hermetia illucens]|uniref:MD-2-related lipid-recognition domain-containing protein n=1 Tax=Hermetia illucens TaxID=343691 RepID=A0A7R8YWV2_HERIL|nr:uncharacterized protein LOC119655481 [Hermetia illucens]CAD7087196.1 unnamed protein product [Hermetia illucens]
MDFAAQVSRIALFLFALYYGITDGKTVELLVSNPMKGSDKNYVDFTTLRLTKDRDTRQLKVSGSFTIGKDMTEEELAYTLYVKSPRSKQFSTTPMYYKAGPICEFIKDDKEFYADAVKVSNLPAPGTCPFPKGTYTINNYLMNEDNIPNVPAGEYRVTITLKSLGKLISGYEAIAKIS